MPAYLWKAKYTVQGLAGVKKDGAAARRDAIAKLAESVGGKLQSIHYAFGDEDVIVILDFPDNVAAARAALAVSGSGSVALETTVLLTVEEVDAALSSDADYRPPGG
jgi:uncharacterized protein with GYD domain